MFEDSEGQGKQPFDNVRETFLCMSHSTLLSMHRNHVEVETTLVATPVTLLLKLASNMTLPSYEGYVGGSS